MLALLPADAVASIPRGTFTTLPSPASSVLRVDPAAPLTLHLDGVYEGGEVRYRVLVRQNPWSKFDLYGLERFKKYCSRY